MRNKSSKGRSSLLTNYKIMLVKEIDISKIKVLRNSRTFEGDVSDLMRSIEKDGLLHPIGVYEKDKDYILAYGFRRLQAYKKLGWKTIPSVIIPEEFSTEDLMTKNTLENIHRKDITPIELGKVCDDFIKHGFTDSEVAAKLHIPASRVKTSLRLLRNIPKKFWNLIGFIERGMPNKGKIPANVATAILALTLSIKDMEFVLNEVRKNNFALRHIYILKGLLRTGMTVDEAIKEVKKNHFIKEVYLRINEKEYSKLNLGERSFNKYVIEILRGKERLNPDLFLD